VRAQRLLVGRPDPVRLALDGVHEIAVLAHERVALRLPDGPALAGVDHQLELGELDREPVAEEVQAHAVRPAQDAGGGDRAYRAAGEAERGASHVGDIAVGVVGARETGGRGIDLLDLAGQVARQVEDVGGLLHHLPARLLLATPPGRRRDRVEPVAGEQPGRVAGEQAAASSTVSR
jgi:hypothetical protein